MEKLIEVLSKSYKKFEIWQESKEIITFEESENGLKKEYQSKKEIAVRVFENGLVGFGYISGEESDYENLLKNLRLALTFAEYDSENILPSPEYKDGINFGSLEEVSENQFLNKIDEIKELTREKPFLKSIERITISGDRRLINFYNSDKGFQSQIINRYAGGVVLVVSKDIDEKMEWDFAIDDNIEKINAKELVERAYNRALKLSNSSPTYTGHYLVLLEPRASSEFLEVFAQSFVGENIYKKKSLISDKNITFSEKLNIYDDPLTSNGSMGFYFDGEGYVGKRKYLVQNGKIVNYLFDTLYGRKLGAKSNGSAIRSKASVPPRNWFSTVIIDKGMDNIQEIIRQRKVIAVVSLIGMHLVNAITGDFSVGFEGYILDDGSYVKSVSGVTISGNLKDLYKSIIAVGDDLCIYGQAGSPTILIDNLVVSGI